LDGHGGHAEARTLVESAWKTWRTHERELKSLEANSRDLELERERLQWQFDELERLALLPREWEELQAEHQRLAHGQALIDGVAQTLATLDEAENSTHHQVTAAEQRIRQLAAHDNH